MGSNPSGLCSSSNFLFLLSANPYLNDEAFDSDGSLPLDLSLNIQKDLSKINPAPFQYIQCYARPGRLLPESLKASLGPIPGTYYMLLGDLPVPEASAQQVYVRARESLEGLPSAIAQYIGNLLEHGGGRLERNVRLLCTDVWPTLYSVLALREQNPLDVWKLPKDAAIALLDENECMGREIRLFYERVQAYYPIGHTVEVALEVMEQVIRFLRAVREDYEAGRV